MIGTLFLYRLRYVFHKSSIYYSIGVILVNNYVILVRKLLKRGKFISLDDLRAQILAFIAYYNLWSSPFHLDSIVLFFYIPFKVEFWRIVFSCWFATIGVVCGLLGTLIWGVFVWPEVLGDAMIKLGNSQTFVLVWSSVGSEGVIAFLQYTWVIGHLLGYILIGMALGRARVIPLWAACLIVGSIPFQAVAYTTHQGIFQLLSYILIFLGSIPAAHRMLNRSVQEASAPA